MRDRVAELGEWDDIKLLTVLVDRLRRWHRPGLLCIGDAAHAMSPIGGVGINLAIQDAVAAANLLAEPLTRGACADADLARVQTRRELPTRVVQRVQVMAQERVIGPALSGKGPQQLPFALKLLRWFPMLRRIPARLVGIGIRPEHVRTGDLIDARRSRPQVASIRNDLAGLNPDVHAHRLVALRLHFDAVRARRQRQRLGRAVEVLDAPGVLAVHEHIRVVPA